MAERLANLRKACMVNLAKISALFQDGPFIIARKVLTRKWWHRSVKKETKLREHKAKAWKERESSQKASQKAQQQR